MSGLSVYMAGKDSSAMKQHTKTQLPVCISLEILADRRVASGSTSSAPVHVHNRDGTKEFPQRQTHRSTPSSGDGFLTRFARNASLVAFGVLKNMEKAGDYVKETVDDPLSPYRKGPK